MKTLARLAGACAVCATLLGCASGGSATGASAGSSSGVTVFGTIDAGVSKTTR